MLKKSLEIVCNFQIVLTKNGVKANPSKSKVYDFVGISNSDVSINSKQ